MQSIQIDFCHPLKRNETLSLSWQLLEHEAAFIWFKLFCKSLKSNRHYFTRFTGFIDGEKNLNYLLSSLNQCIDIINKDGRYFIREKAIAFSQDFANAIHHHFEILSGNYDAPTEYIKLSSPEVSQAVSGLNYFIHDLEAYERNHKLKHTKEYGNSFSGIIVEIKNSERFKIPKSFDKYFTIDTNFGDLVAHYSQIGKTWLEVFLDHDEKVHAEAILPLYAFSGEFDIMFGQLNPDKIFLYNLNNFLKSRGLNLDDPSLRLGYLPLAKMARDEKISNFEYKKLLSYFCDIKSIKAYNGQRCIAQKSLIGTTSFFQI